MNVDVDDGRHVRECRVINVIRFTKQPRLSADDLETGGLEKDGGWRKTWSREKRGLEKERSRKRGHCTPHEGIVDCRWKGVANGIGQELCQSPSEAVLGPQKGVKNLKGRNVYLLLVPVGHLVKCVSHKVETCCAGTIKRRVEI